MSMNRQDHGRVACQCGVHHGGRDQDALGGEPLDATEIQEGYGPVVAEDVVPWMRVAVEESVSVQAGEHGTEDRSPSGAGRQCLRSGRAGRDDEEASYVLAGGAADEPCRGRRCTPLVGRWRRDVTVTMPVHPFRSVS